MKKFYAGVLRKYLFVQFYLLELYRKIVEAKYHDNQTTTCHMHTQENLTKEKRWLKT